MSLGFVPLDGPFGVRGPDIDLTAIDEDAFLAIKDAVRREALVLFRRQALLDQDLEALSRRFGRVEVPANANAHSPITPHVVYISNLKDEAARSIGGGGSGEMQWHSDQAFRAHPATLSLLYAVVVPPAGGHTFWCSTRLGFAALPDALKTRVRALRGTYLPGASHTIEKVEVSHPLVLRMPDGSAEFLYVSRSTRSIEGLDQDEAESLLAQLLGYQLQHEHVYEHRWRPGDLMLYDNGQTLHRRDPFDGLRFMKGTRAFVSPEEFPVPD